jgi:heme oxygenase (biliverdin-IX-beta and delta-forming)
MPTAAVLTEPSFQTGGRDAVVGGGLRRRLRSATADAHARLDEQVRALDLRHLSDYRRFLEASAAALLPLEAALIEAGVQRIFSDWTLRSRRRAILHDLACVGGVARPLAVPRPLDFDGVLGTMYVLEGSRLGAQVLLQAVAGSSDAAVTAATAYLRHGAGRHLWQSFLALLERHAEILRHETGAVNAARRAFDLFVDAIARTSRPSAQPGDRSVRP